ncbi:MAG: RNA polymerase sigma factor [Bacteroidota bacterium]
MTTANLSLTFITRSNITLEHQITACAEYLNNFALKLTRNAEEAADLYQDTMYLIIKNRDKYEIGTNFKAWVSTIMRNTFINSYRKRRRYQTVIEEVPSAQRKSEINKGEINIFMEEMQATIQSLGELYEVPLRMVGEGYQYEEIATALGLPLSTVKSRIFFARKKMRALYPNYAMALLKK